MKVKFLYTFLLFAINYNLSAQWLCPWENRIPLSITESSGNDLSKYQIRIDLTYSVGMNPDFSDIRFTTSDGTTLMDFWIEYYEASSKAVVWVEIPNIAANSITSTYLYYCNTSATPASNPVNTFIFFDDFVNWSGWSNYNNGIVAQDNTTFSGTSTLAKTIYTAIRKEAINLLEPLSVNFD